MSHPSERRPGTVAVCEANTRQTTLILLTALLLAPLAAAAEQSIKPVEAISTDLLIGRAPGHMQLAGPRLPRDHRAVLRAGCE